MSFGGLEDSVSCFVAWRQHVTLAEFRERVYEPPLAQVRKKGALPLCCCVLTKPACAYMLEAGLATWQDLPTWTRAALPGAAQDGGGLARGAPGQAERQCFDRLWARNVDLVYLMRASNSQLDGHGCQYRQTFVDAAGHWDQTFVTQPFHFAAWELGSAGQWSAVWKRWRYVRSAPKWTIRILVWRCSSATPRTGLPGTL